MNRDTEDFLDAALKGIREKLKTEIQNEFVEEGTLLGVPFKVWMEIKMYADSLGMPVDQIIPRIKALTVGWEAMLKIQHPPIIISLPSPYDDQSRRT